MAKIEDLKAMGIIEEPKPKKINKPNASNNDRIENSVATIIQGLAILEGFIAAIIGIIAIVDAQLIGFAIIIGGIISAIFVYALGEIIQLLEDIKNKK